MGNTGLSDRFAIAETETFQRNIQKHGRQALYAKITCYVYPQLRQNPFFGPNIKKLKGELKDFYRYRIGDYRLFYTVESNTITVFIMDIRPRKDAY